MNIVALDFNVRYECKPSLLIMMYRYYQVPIICDFLYILSQIQAPYANSLNYYTFGLVYSGILIDFESNFILKNFRKISINLSLPLLSNFQGQLKTTSSSFPMPIFSLLTDLEPKSPQLRESLLILKKGSIFLLISNSLSKNTSQVYDTNFFSSKVTLNLFCSEAKDDFQDDFPFDFLASIFLLVICQPIYYQLLFSCSSEEEVPNSYFFNLIISFFRFIFILMYQSCIRLNSASFSSSLNPPTHSQPLIAICLYSISFPEICSTTNCFFGCCPRISVLLVPYCIFVLYKLMDSEILVQKYASKKKAHQLEINQHQVYVVIVSEGWIKLNIIKMIKQSRKALSLQALSKHQERVKNMVDRIDKYKPTFNSNKQYLVTKRKEIQKRMEKRQEQSDKLLQENIKLIYRIQTTGPKIQTKKFPQIKYNAQRAKTLSVHSKNTSKTKFKILDTFRNEDELFEENIKLITNIESTGPKISCWTSKKVRNLNQLLVEKKRDQQKKILQKFKDISKQFTKLSKMRSFKRSSSITSLKNKSMNI